MPDFLQGVLAEIDGYSIAELIALVLGVAYLLLAIRESLWCWLCALLSSSIFALLFARSLIYMDAVLQVLDATTGQNAVSQVKLASW